MRLIHDKARALAVLLQLACASYKVVAVAETPAQALYSVQITTETGSLQFSPAEGKTDLLQATTELTIAVSGGAGALLKTVDIYACISPEQVMKSAKKAQSLPLTSLRIRNDRLEWSPLEALPVLGACNGVRIAVVHNSSATIPLEMQIQVPRGQLAATYQGNLTLQAVER